jgi:hypothetical protein
MATRQNKRKQSKKQNKKQNKSKRGSGMFSQGLRSFGISVGDSTSDATKQIVKILTSKPLTEEQKSQIRPLLQGKDQTFYENLNRDLANAGVNSLAMTDILLLIPPQPSLPSLLHTI